LSEKNETNYQRLLKHLDIDAKEFLMVGNSLKSDVLPIINLGARAIHVPFHTTWQFETPHENDLKNKNFHTVSSLTEILNLIKG